MKPHEKAGVELEGLGEVNTAVLALDFVAGYGTLPSDKRGVLGGLAMMLRGMYEVLEGVAPLQDQVGVQQEVNVALAFENEIEALMVVHSVAIAAKHYPDPMIRLSAGDMYHGYADAVFEDAMDEPPAENV